MSPSKAATTWMVPEICSTDELAAWLGVTINELDWFADLKLLANRKGSGKLTHYHYRPLTKRPGAIRLIESPKARLKSIQRQILCGIIDQIPAHDAVHGFRRGRSIQSFAEPHVNKHIVLKMDLQDFFPSILMARVQALFRTGGYPEKIADSLAGLCSNATPLQIWESFDSIPNDDRTRQIRWMYARPHLPQGAPTSPAVANLCAYRLDCRLSALAQSVGAVYTRYADDLAFSGNREFARNIDRFIIHVGATVMEEGFRVNHRKTRKMRPGVRQQIAGIVVNQHLAVPRRERDQLKATLSNCIRFGPGTQNRNDEIDFRSHLLGRITYIESVNPNHGRKLRELYNEIQWDSSE